jgi:hypothetical protein
VTDPNVPTDAETVKALAEPAPYATFVQLAREVTTRVTLKAMSVTTFAECAVPGGK